MSEGQNKTKNLSLFSWIINHLKVSKSAGIKKNDQMSTKFLDSSNMKIYAVLLHFENVMIHA